MPIIYTRSRPTYGRDLKLGDLLDHPEHEGARTIHGLSMDSRSSVVHRAFFSSHPEDSQPVHVNVLYDVVEMGSRVEVPDDDPVVQGHVDDALLAEVAEIARDKARRTRYTLTWEKVLDVCGEPEEVRAVMWEEDQARIDALPRWRRVLHLYRRRAMPTTAQVRNALGHVGRSKTIGACLDAGAQWDQFSHCPPTISRSEGRLLFTSAEDAEAHRDDPIGW